MDHSDHPSSIISRALRALPTAVLTVVDPVITLLGFGLYYPQANEEAPSFHVHFSFSTLWANLLPFSTATGYSFTRSPFEFALLCLIRTLLHIVSIVSIVRLLRPTIFQGAEWGQRLGGVLKAAQLTNFTYTVFKFLALSEYEEQLYCAGVWVSCVWNVLALLLTRQLWKSSLRAPGTPYSTLVNEESEAAALPESSSNGTASSNGMAVPDGPSETTPLAREEGEASGDKKEEEEKVVESLISTSTLEHIVVIMKYSLHYWPWLAVGLVFIVAYSIGEGGGEKGRTF